MKSSFPLPPFLLSGSYGILEKKTEDPLFLCECCALHVSPPGKGGNNSVLISIFQPILTNYGSFTETPAAAVAARGSSPYLIQFVNAGADGSEFAVRDPTNCKHPIKDAPVVDLGERSSTSGIMNSTRCFSSVLLCSPVVLSMEENIGDVCQGVFLLFAISLSHSWGAELPRADQIAQLTSTKPGQSHHISF